MRRRNVILYSMTECLFDPLDNFISDFYFAHWERVKYSKYALYCYKLFILSNLT